MRRVRRPSPAYHELPEPVFDVYEQPEVENERDAGRGSEASDDLISKQCLSPNVTGYHEDSPSDPFPKSGETREGTNRLGNKWRKDPLGDGTIEYQYQNRDGSSYEKYRDGSADFLTPRGYPKHYPAASRNAPETR